MSDSRMALLIDYEYCTGCHSCETACKVELGLPLGQYGIKVATYGPAQIPGTDKWDYINVPIPTALCDLCENRVKDGKLPTCVHHCQAACMEYGTVEELAAKMAGKSKMVLFTPK